LPQDTKARLLDSKQHSTTMIRLHTVLSGTYKAMACQAELQSMKLSSVVLEELTTKVLSGTQKRLAAHQEQPMRCNENL
jgi:site-specific recombinase XerC